MVTDGDQMVIDDHRITVVGDDGDQTVSTGKHGAPHITVTGDDGDHTLSVKTRRPSDHGQHTRP